MYNNLSFGGIFMSKVINVKDLKEKQKIIIGVIILIVILLFISSFRTIKSGEVGIKVRFGKVINTHIYFL